jgi:hypothetical protein
MARKHEPGHQPYSPVDEKLIRSLPSVFSSGSSLEQEKIQEKIPNDITMKNEPIKEKTIVPVQEPLNKQLKFQVSGAEMREIRRIVGQLGSELEASLNWSHVARALLVIFKQAEDEIIKHARRSEPLVRPQNSDALALAEFENEIAKILLKGFKGMKALE